MRSSFLSLHCLFSLHPFSSLGAAADKRNSLLHLSYGLLVGAPKAGEVMFSPMLTPYNLETLVIFQTASRFIVQELQLGCQLQNAKTK